MRLRVATFPKPYKDVCDLIQSAGPDAFGRMIDEAKAASAWIVDNVEDLGANLHTPEGQTAAAELLLEMLAALPAIEREARVSQLAERMELSVELLRQALNEIWLSRRRTSAPERPLASRFVEDRRPL